MMYCTSNSFMFKNEESSLNYTVEAGNITRLAYEFNIKNYSFIIRTEMGKDGNYTCRYVHHRLVNGATLKSYAKWAFNKNGDDLSCGMPGFHKLGHFSVKGSDAIYQSAPSSRAFMSGTMVTIKGVGVVNMMGNFVKLGKTSLIFDDNELNVVNFPGELRVDVTHIFS